MKTISKTCNFQWFVGINKINYQALALLESKTKYLFCCLNESHSRWNYKFQEKWTGSNLKIFKD